jgi:hypothetical protein
MIGKERCGWEQISLQSIAKKWHALILIECSPWFTRNRLRLVKLDYLLRFLAPCWTQTPPFTTCLSHPYGCSASLSPHAGHRLRLVGLYCRTRLGCIFCVSLSPHAGHRLRLVRLYCHTRLGCSFCFSLHPSPCHASRLGPTLHEDPGTNAKRLGS